MRVGIFAALMLFPVLKGNKKLGSLLLSHWWKSAFSLEVKATEATVFLNLTLTCFAFKEMGTVALVQGDMEPPRKKTMIQCMQAVFLVRMRSS